MKRLFLPEDFTPESIWLYYERSQAALAALRREVLANPSLFPLFQGMSVPEFEESLRDTRQELDSQVTMALIASFEAIIRLNFRGRISRRLKDPTSKRLRGLARAWRPGEAHKASLEQILDIWKQAVGNAQTIGRFKQLLKFRHWLAHGRYWAQTSGITPEPDPEMAWEIGSALFKKLPGFPQLN